MLHFWRYSWRREAEWLQMIWGAPTTELLKSRLDRYLSLMWSRRNNRPTPLPWVGEGPSPSSFSMFKNCIFTVRRELCKDKQGSHRDLETMWRQEGALTFSRDGRRLDSEEKGTPLCSSEWSSRCPRFKYPCISIFCWLTQDSWVLSTGMMCPSSLSTLHVLDICLIFWIIYCIRPWETCWRESRE